MICKINKLALSSCLCLLYVIISKFKVQTLGDLFYKDAFMIIKSFILIKI